MSNDTKSNDTSPDWGTFRRIMCDGKDCLIVPLEEVKRLYNTERHLYVQLTFARQKSSNRRRAIKDLLRMNEFHLTQLRLVWAENRNFRERITKLMEPKG